MWNPNYFLTFSIALTSIAQNAISIPIEKELTLTLREKRVLDQFKSIILPKLPYDFLKTDLSLIRYLRAQNLDLKRTEEMILNTVRWRKQNKIDGINNEDWYDFELDYKYFMSGTDKLGRPLIYMFAQEWDIRRGVVTGNEQKIIRYFWKILEDASIKIREAQEAGKNVTQCTFIYDMTGYNLIQHGCAQCIPSLIQFLVTYENHYPGFMHKINLINTPSVFQLLLNVMRPLMSEVTREALQIYGTDKSQWRKALKQEISDDNLMVDLGGNLPRPIY